MSTSYCIYRFSKPSKKDLALVDCYSDYDSFPVYDGDGDGTGEHIRLFRETDKEAGNIINSRFAVRLTLPERVIDRKALYKAIGFSQEAVEKDAVHISFSNGLYAKYTDGEHSIQIPCSKLDEFEITVQVKCAAIKMECLWDSDEACCYADSGRVRKYLPGLQDYRYVPVSNLALSKAEIPFLVYARNRGRCFIEKY